MSIGIWLLKCGGGGGGVNELVKKGKFVAKISDKRNYNG